MRVRTISAAATELAEAVRWYEQRRPGLGAELLREVDHALQRLRSNPESGTLTPVGTGSRRMPLGRFPFTVAYLLRPDEIVVVAFAHAKRRPGYWAERS